MLNLMAHELWPQLFPYFRLSIGAGRQRIEVDDLPTGLHALAMRILLPCVHCGDSINPIRHRVGPNERAIVGSMYYSGTCLADVKAGCHKGLAASIDTDLMASAILTRDPSIRKPTNQLDMFHE